MKDGETASEPSTPTKSIAPQEIPEAPDSEGKLAKLKRLGSVSLRPKRKTTGKGDALPEPDTPPSVSQQDIPPATTPTATPPPPPSTPTPEPDNPVQTDIKKIYELQRQQAEQIIQLQKQLELLQSQVLQMKSETSGRHPSLSTAPASSEEIADDKTEEQKDEQTGLTVSMTSDNSEEESSSSLVEVQMLRTSGGKKPQRSGGALRRRESMFGAFDELANL